MAFKSSNDVEARLRTDNTKLTPAEVHSLMSWMNQISEVGMRRLNAELSLQNLEAVHKFERSSSRLAWVLIALTGALFFLTLVVAYYTYLVANPAH
jgi:hypothetical protein